MGGNENALDYWGYAGTPAPTWNDYMDDRPVGPVFGYVVEFDVSVPVDNSTWGQLKALFR
jgi:hypothetical protein